MNTRTLLITSLTLGLVLAGVLAARAQEQPPAASTRMPGLPNLVGALESSPGCLGVELAETRSGKKVIFAWFQDRQAVVRWYHSEAHQQIMDTLFQGRGEGDYHKPLDGVPDDIGPIMVIVSITPAEKPHFKEMVLPVSQIAIELYTPLSGGVALGGRFAPASLKVPNLQDYTPAPTQP